MTFKKWIKDNWIGIIFVIIVIGISIGISIVISKYIIHVQEVGLKTIVLDIWNGGK